MADAQDADEAAATAPSSSKDESSHDRKGTDREPDLSATGLQHAFDPSPSTSNTSTENPLENNDSGIMLEKSPATPSPETQLSKNDSGIALERKSCDAEQSDSGSVLPVPELSDNEHSIDIDVDEEMQESDIDLESVGLRRQRQRNRNILHSSSENDDSHMSDANETRTDEEEDDDEEVDSDNGGSEAQAAVDFPRDSWHPFHEIISRERGASSNHYGSFLLREKAGASINLVRRLKLHRSLKHHGGCVNSLHFNSTGSLLASGSDDLNIVVWDWARGKPYFVFDSGHRSNVFQSKFVPHSGDSLLVSCARDGCVRLAEFSSAGACRGTKKLAQHKGAAHKLALLDDSPHVCYSCGEDAAVFQIDLRQNKPDKLCVTKENERKIPLYSIHTHPSRTHEFCVAGRDPYIRIYDTRMLREDEENMACVKKFCPHHLMADGNSVVANVTCAVYNWNGTEVIGTYNDEDIYMFNTTHSDSANFIHRYKGHRNNATVKGVNFYGPKSEYIVSGSDCGNVFLWDKETENIVNFFSADEGGVVNVLEPHPHNPYLATSGLDNDVKIFLPTSENPSNLDGLKQVMRRNHREREEERSSEPDMIDGHMMWVLLQHLRRSARSQAREGGADLSSSSDDDNDHEEFDDSDDADAPPHCATS